MKKINVVASNMASWVIAMESFYKVNLVVRPMKEELKVAEAKFAKVDAELSIKKEALRKKQAEVDGLRAELQAIQDEKQRLADEVADCEARLITATKLIEGLGGEKTRWKQQSEELAITFVNLTGDVLISSGMIAYLGAFNSVFRDELADLWVKGCEEKEIPNGGTFSL
jgi:dynein heavy chain